ncbi:MAG: hypothetical protein Q9165_002214 [Trypethelium subeluteriae]
MDDLQQNCNISNIMDTDVLQALTILAFQVDEQNEGLYRILDGSHVRYLRILSGTFDEETMCCAHLLLPLLPSFPKGPWTTMELHRGDDGNVVMRTSSEPLEEVECSWHSNRVDVLTLPKGTRLKTNVWETIYQGHPAILKIASFPWEIYRMEWETWAYGRIYSYGGSEGAMIAPSVIAHVVENGRVMGLLLEKVEGDHAGIADLELCRSVLHRLHKMGIRHGDPCRYNFMVDHKEGRLRILDFENARPLSPLGDASAEDELRMLEDELRDDTGRGAGILSQLSPQDDNFQNGG